MPEPPPSVNWFHTASFRRQDAKADQLVPLRSGYFDVINLDFILSRLLGAA
jgi:hypothetical protein